MQNQKREKTGRVGGGGYALYAQHQKLEKNRKESV